MFFFCIAYVKLDVILELIGKNVSILKKIR